MAVRGDEVGDPVPDPLPTTGTVGVVDVRVEVRVVVIMAGIVVVLRTVRMGAIACHMAYRGTPNRLRLLL